MTPAAEASSPGGFLGLIEKVGNKVPHPVVMFLYLIAIVAVISTVLYAFDVSVTTEVAAHVAGQNIDHVCEDPIHQPPPPELDESDYLIKTETIDVNRILTIDGLLFVFSSFVTNFANFSVVAVLFVAIIGVGVA